MSERKTPSSLLKLAERTLNCPSRTKDRLLVEVLIINIAQRVLTFRSCASSRDTSSRADWMISDGSAEAAAPALLLLGTLRNRLGFTACAEQAPAAMQDIPYWQGHGFRLRWALSSCL